ncbi:uncharacterized protein LOC34624470 [Cyclospora cayetanensis]|uniref:mRNA 5'-phosphatase n=1 Tax=Cyclospora cayetanensis TaxID=88456 RepID=A0A6P6RZN4_9EIME|nr:uncharacterized protein LOC34624470 [Cyclospora cayetanensis]
MTSLPALPPAAAAHAAPAAASPEPAAAASSLQTQERRQHNTSDSIPRGPLPTSLLVLAEALDGSFCPLINELTQQLVQQLLLLHEEHPCLFQLAESPSGGPHEGSLRNSPGLPAFSLEVEGRLGVIRERDSGSRLQLPVASHAVLQPSFCMQVGGPSGGPPEGEEGPQARFVAGVSPAQFADLKELLLKNVALNSRAAGRRLQVHLALMGIEPSSGGSLESPDEHTDTEEEEDSLNASPAVRSRQQEKGSIQSSRVMRGGGVYSLEGEDWTVLSEKETEENYFHIPALQAAARFSSLRGPSLPGGRGGPLLGMSGLPGASMHIQNLNQLLVNPGIYKRGLLQWNVYTGADKDDAFRSTELWSSSAAGAEDVAERPRVDYRLAINFEHKIEVKELQKSLMQAGGAPQGRGASAGYGGSVGSAEPQLRRQRHRQSLAILHKQKTGDPRPLWCLCATFLSLLRELAAPLNSPLGVKGGPTKDVSRLTNGVALAEGEWADLGDVQLTEAEGSAFKHFLSDRLPLIGDYAYRAVAQSMKAKSADGTEVAPSLCEFLKNPEVEQKCLYTHNKTQIPGPWIPHRDADGRVHLVELQR